MHKGTTNPGEHAAIIDRALWDGVNTIMQQSSRQRASRTRAQTPALLKGLICGRPAPTMSPTHARKRDRLYHYYVGQAVLKHGREGCPIARVPAGKIEAAAVGHLRVVFQ